MTLKTIFVVEGQTERIFIENFINQLVSGTPLAITIQQLHGGNLITIREPIDEKHSATHKIQIIDVGGDDVVNSFISDNLTNFRKRGWEAVYGLRDRFTGDTKKIPVDQARVDTACKTMSTTSGLSVDITVAEQEVEAWFISVPAFFQTYHKELTKEEVVKIMSADYSKLPVESIPHPSALIKKVLATRQLNYRKRTHDAHKIASCLDYSDLYLTQRNRISALDRFITNLESALP